MMKMLNWYKSKFKKKWHSLYYHRTLQLLLLHTEEMSEMRTNLSLKLTSAKLSLRLLLLKLKYLVSWFFYCDNELLVVLKLATFYIKNWFCFLTHFSATFPFYTPWKYKKTLDFVIFSGGINLRWVNLFAACCTLN